MAASVTAVKDRGRTRALKNLKHISEATVACRGEQHRWPKMRMVRGRLERGTRVGPRMRDGTRRVDQTCRDCGRCRWKITGAGGLIKGGTWQYYGGPDDFYQPDLSKADFRAESERRLLEAMDEAEQLSAASEARKAERMELLGKARNPFPAEGGGAGQGA